MEVNKEALTSEFTRQNEIRLSRIQSQRAREEEDLKQYFAELESAAAGLNTAKAVRDDTATSRGDSGTFPSYGIKPAS